MEALARMLVPRTLVILVAALVVAVVPGAAVAQSTVALTIDQPFADAPAVLRAVAEGVSTAKPADAVVLLREVTLRVDSEGRWTSVRRHVVHLRTPAGAKSWAMLSALWRPWHQQRPQLKARVITAAGEEHWLDPATIGETPRYEGREVLSDWRSLRAPLPAVAAGAVIETLTREEDERPFFAGGMVDSYWVQRREPVVLARFRVEAPVGRTLRFDLSGLAPTEPVRERTGETERWLYELRDIPPAEDLPSHLPPEVRRWPGFAVASGASWAEVARLYSEVVEAQLREADLSGVVQRELAGVEGRDAKIRRLVEWLHREVRYTGLEFGEAAIVPRSPQEVLARKYGDCKDKAALLAALLRQAGIPAHLALLNSGNGEDISPDLPGLGAFDHAILYVPGSPELWIDATAEQTRVGELPTGSIDRWALVASPETAGLTRTPPPRPDSAVLRSRAEVKLIELGFAEVVATIEFGGSPEQGLRTALAAVGKERLVEELKRRGFESIGDVHLIDLEIENLGHLDQPLRLVLSVDQAKDYFTDLESAAVPVSYDDLKTYLPRPFLPAADGKDALKAGGKGPESRSLDWYLPEVPSVDLSYRLVPPVGYVATDLPQPIHQGWGPVSFDQSFRRLEDESVIMEARIHFARHRFPAAEGEEIRRGLSELLTRDAPSILFEHVGEAHLAAGRTVEAIAEMRRLVNESPTRALPRSRLARAYAEAGLGETARAEVARAVAMEPESAPVHRAQGLILMRDLLGRFLVPGWDGAGAERALRKAFDLEPAGLHHALSLGLALEHDSQGRRYQAGPRLDEAISLYQAAKQDDGDVDLGAPLLVALIRAGRLAEAETLARERAATEEDFAGLAAAIAALRGSAEAITAMSPISDAEQRQTVLRKAGFLLYQLRLYGLSADFYSAAAMGADGGQLLAQAALLRRARKHEELPADPQSPVSWTIRLLRPHFISSSADEQVFVSLAAAAGHDPAAAGKERDAERRHRAAGLNAEDIPETAVLDVSLANLETAVEDGPGGARRVRFRIGEEDWDLLYLRATPTALEPIALGSLGLEPLGDEALRLIEAGDLEGARGWLDWAREEVTEGAGAEPFYEAPLARLWAEGSAGDEGQMRVAAAALRATGPHAAEAMVVLEAALERETRGTERQALQVALQSAAFKTERYERALALTEELLAANPRSESSFLVLFGQHYRAQCFEPARSLATERLILVPKDPSALRLLAELSAQEGRMREAAELSKELIRTGHTLASDYNNAAWYELMAGPIGEQTLTTATRGVELGEDGGESSLLRGALNTLAAVYAQLDRPSEARQVLLEAITADGVPEPEPADWLVIGRIAEHYGLSEAAKSAYSRVIEEVDDDGSPTAAAQLARSWLERVAAQPPAQHP